MTQHDLIKTPIRELLDWGLGSARYPNLGDALVANGTRKTH